MKRINTRHTRKSLYKTHRAVKAYNKRWDEASIITKALQRALGY